MVHKQRYVPNSRVSRHGYALDGTPQHNDHQNNNASSFTMKFYLKVRYKDLEKKLHCFQVLIFYNNKSVILKLRV